MKQTILFGYFGWKVSALEAFLCPTRYQVYIAEIRTRGNFRDRLMKKEFEWHRCEINCVLREQYDPYFVQFKTVVYTKDYDEEVSTYGYIWETSTLLRHEKVLQYNRIRRIFCSYLHCLNMQISVNRDIFRAI